jgi:dTDP-4-dehydrorhamnose reductase
LTKLYNLSQNSTKLFTTFPKTQKHFTNVLRKPQLFKNKNLQIVHITTDCVFNGELGNYIESSFHDCIDDYGKSKSLGENPHLTTLRT